MNRSRFRLPGLCAAAALSIACVAPARAADLDAGRKTFEEICAACHGPTGRPDPANQTVQALDPQPADLSDPLFNSREPVADWQIVVTQAGQPSGCRRRCPRRRARSRWM